jgi:hypothetical protein
MKKLEYIEIKMQINVHSQSLILYNCVLIMDHINHLAKKKGARRPSPAGLLPQTAARRAWRRPEGGRSPGSQWRGFTIHGCYMLG